MKTIDLLRLQFPGALRLSLPQCAAATGFAVATVRNRIHARTWPIPAQREGGPRGRLYFDIRDIAKYLDEKAAGAIRRRGRPTKAEEIARTAADTGE